MEQHSVKGGIRFTGLNDASVMKSRLDHGENLMAPPTRKAWWKQLLGKFDDPIIRILIIAALIAIVTGELIEGIGIIIAILLATLLAFFNEFKAEKEFDILNKVNDDIPVKVIRNSQIQMVSKREIVVEDIVFIELGEEVPADGHILESVNLQVDQSKLTGESEPVHKQDVKSAQLLPEKEETYPIYMLLRGTPVVEGHGYMQVTAVGEKTEIGKTAMAASEDTEDETPLNEQLERLSKFIGVVGFSVASITFLALIAQGYIGHTINQTTTQWMISGILLFAIIVALVKVWLPVLYDGISLIKSNISRPNWLIKKGVTPWLIFFILGILLTLLGLGTLYAMGTLPESISNWISPEALPRFISFFMVAVTLIVVAVPEGLAMSVTLSLAYSMRKMTASNNLVRKMHACETIGAATVICTDKTGTLTMNQMRVQEAVFPVAPLDFVALAVAVNSTAHLSLLDPSNPQPIGNPTEGALLLHLHAQTLDYESIRSRFKTITQWTFSTERKFMATKGETEHGELILFAKGAPEILLNRCVLRETPDGLLPLDDNAKASILKSLLSYQARGMRTLGFTYLKNPSHADDVLDAAQAMIWMGFMAIADPVRPDVPMAISRCFKAGIQVKMVTGDNPETAKEIGRQINLWDDLNPTKYQLLTGVEFAALTDEEAHVAASELKIMARARPNDKLRLVRCLKNNGEIVAVTGDGTNDAPALNYSDVGIAMGKTGTSIAKEASDIILLDDSFTSIVNAVMWGRSLYRNIQKFILFQLTVNVVALSIAMLGPFIGVELPLTVVQMLWINLIMDTFAALALATDPPDPKVMDFKPRKNSAFIVTPTMWMGIFGVALVFISTLIGLLLYMESRHLAEDLRWLTIFFSVLVMMQFWNLFNAKCWGTHDSVLTRLFDNKSFFIIAMVIFIAQIGVVQFGGKIFRATPLSLTDWLYVIGGSSLIFFGGELFRLILRIKNRTSC